MPRQFGDFRPARKAHRKAAAGAKASRDAAAVKDAGKAAKGAAGDAKEKPCEPVKPCPID